MKTFTGILYASILFVSGLVIFQGARAIRSGFHDLIVAPAITASK